MGRPSLPPAPHSRDACVASPSHSCLLFNFDAPGAKVCCRVQNDENIRELTGHIIMCGAEESFCTFLEQLRRVEPQKMPVVLLHPTWNRQLWESLSSFGPIFFIRVAPCC